MHFFRHLLFPFSILYGGVMAGRNFLYDQGIWQSRTFPVPLIGVGNLTVGGTGKTPHVEYLLRLLQGFHRATLSRGYGRKTKSFILADEKATSSSIGDEPFQYYLDFPGVAVAVCEDRIKGMERLLEILPATEVVLLDDVFQHRPVQPHLNLLVTDYGRLFYRDVVMPTGRLREHPTGAKRADAVIVSKCPAGLTAEEMDQIRGKVRFYAREETPVFFSTYRYGEPIPFGGAAVCQQKVILVTGIATPAPINDYLRQAGFTVVEHLAFRDHYPYTAEDLEKIKKLIAASNGEPLSVITTRKDAVRLLEPAYKPLREALPLFYLPIEVSFLRDQENFDKLVLSRVKTISEGSFL